MRSIKLIDFLKRHAILKSSFVLILITMAVKILGYGEKLLLAYYWGTGIEVDTYTLVTTIILAFFFFFREIIEPGYLTVFIKTRKENGEAAAWNLFKAIFILILGITTLLSFLMIIFPQQTIQLFAPGFNEDYIDKASGILRISGIACVFLSLSTLTYITLNAYKIFAVAALGDLFQKAGILIPIVFLYKKIGIYSAALGIVVGALFRIISHLPVILKKMSWDIRIHIEKRPLKEVWILAWPLLFGVFFSQLNSIADNIFASGLSEGSISALSFSRKLVELPVVLLPYAVSVVLFPYLSQYVAEQDTIKLKLTIIQALQWISVLFIPVSIFFAIMSHQLVELVFQRGAFDVNSTVLTARPLRMYSIGMLFFALETVVVIIYFSFSDTKTPIFTGIICASLNLLITFLLVKPLGSQGIALSLVISKMIKVITLLILLKKKMEVNVRSICPFIIRLVPGIVFFTVCILLLNHFGTELNISKPVSKLFILSFGFILPASIYLLITNKALKLFSFSFK